MAFLDGIRALAYLWVLGDHLYQVCDCCVCFRAAPPPPYTAYIAWLITYTDMYTDMYIYICTTPPYIKSGLHCGAQRIRALVGVSR